MSRSYLVQVYKTKHVKDEELSNSWGSKPQAWDFIWKQLFPNEQPDSYSVYASQANMDRLYEKLDDKTVARWIKTALFLSGWRCCVLKEHVSEAAKDLRIFEQAISPSLTAKNHTNHWPAIANYFNSIKPDRRLIGLALHGTSVDDEWDRYNLKQPITYSTGLYD